MNRLAFAVTALLLITGADARERRTELPLGEPAPDFTLKDLDGKEVSLSSFHGKVVVLEWYNPECPFVRYAHTKGPLHKMGDEQTAAGVVWLAINSGAPGRQGHGAELNKKKRDAYAIGYPILLDPTGEVGRAYGARTTPHMFVIDRSGRLAYRGALDDAPLGDLEAPELTNHVAHALADLMANRPVARSATRPYGCSVKYAE